MIGVRWFSSSSEPAVVVNSRKAVIWQVVIPVLLLRLMFRCTSRRRHVVVERALSLGCAGSDRRSQVFLKWRQSRRAGGRPVGGSRRVVSKATVKGSESFSGCPRALPSSGEGYGEKLTRVDPLNSLPLRFAAQVHPAVKLSHPQTSRWSLKKPEGAGPGSASSFEPRGAPPSVSVAPG